MHIQKLTLKITVIQPSDWLLCPSVNCMVTYFFLSSGIIHMSNIILTDGRSRVLSKYDRYSTNVDQKYILIRLYITLHTQRVTTKMFIIS